MATAANVLSNVKNQLIAGIGQLNAAHKSQDYFACSTIVDNIDSAADAFVRELRGILRKQKDPALKEAIMNNATTMSSNATQIKSTCRIAFANNNLPEAMPAIMQMAVALAKDLQSIMQMAALIQTDVPLANSTPATVPQTPPALKHPLPMSAPASTLKRPSTQNISPELLMSPEFRQLFPFAAHQFFVYVDGVHSCAVKMADAIDRKQKEAFGFVTYTILEQVSDLLAELEDIDFSTLDPTFRTMFEQKRKVMFTHSEALSNATRLASGFVPPEGAEDNLRLATIVVAKTVKEFVVMAQQTMLYIIRTKITQLQRQVTAEAAVAANQASASANEEPEEDISPDDLSDLLTKRQMSFYTDQSSRRSSIASMSTLASVESFDISNYYNSNQEEASSNSSSVNITRRASVESTASTEGMLGLDKLEHVLAKNPQTEEGVLDGVDGLNKLEEALSRKSLKISREQTPVPEQNASVVPQINTETASLTLKPSITRNDSIKSTTSETKRLQRTPTTKSILKAVSRLARRSSVFSVDLSPSRSGSLDRRGSLFGFSDDLTSSQRAFQSDLSAEELDKIKEKEQQTEAILVRIEEKFTSSVDITFKDGDGEVLVKSGSLKSLVERLTWHRHPDPIFASAFLMTYRSFTTPQKLLQELVDRFDIKPPESITDPEELTVFEQRIANPIQIRVFNIIKTWVDKHYYDFKDDQELMNQLETFLQDDVQPKSDRFAMQLRKRLAEKKKQGDHELLVESTDLEKAPASRVPRPITMQTDIVDVDDLELARQLTVMTFAQYRAIRPKEFLNQSWNNYKKMGEKAKTTVNHMIDAFNNLSTFVATNIVRGDTDRKRGTRLTFWINVSDKCRKLENFNSLMAIIASLNSSAIRRLANSWDKVSPKDRKLFDELNTIMSSQSNYSALRTTLHALNPPCIPYLGMYLTDLTFIEDGNKDMIDNLINFDKRRKISYVIREIQQYQQVSYHLRPVPELQALILSKYNDLLTEDQIYDQSLIAEPRTK